MVLRAPAPDRLKVASLHPDVPGELIGTALGEYQLVEYLGRGGMADVYAAFRTEPDGSRSRFAIKRFMRKLASDQRLSRLFLHEARLSTLLRHPNLVRGVDFGVADGAPYLVMELIEGVPCDVVQRWSNKRLPAPLAISIVRRVLSALAYVHRATSASGEPLGIVHHDVSPDNILLGRLGEVKLSDFGVAMSAYSADVASMRLRGKLGYMAPEQVAGLRTDARSDLFSAGVLLAELLLGHRLFEQGSELEVLVRAYDCDVGNAFAELDPRVRAATESVLLRALARDPAARFASAREFADALSASAARLGDTPDAGDLALWLLERGLVGTASGVRRIGAEPTPDAGEVARKIAGAHLEVMTAAEEPAPRPRSHVLPRSNERFRARTVGGRSLPETSTAGLLEQIATGRVDRGVEVIADDGRPVPLHAHPTFSFAARLAVHHFDDGTENRAEWVQPFERSKLPALLFSLARSRATGLFALRAGARHKRVYFAHGEPVFIASSEPSELFGHFAVSRGLLDASQLDEVVAWAARQGRRLGDAIVALGLAPSGLVLRALLDQFERRFCELASWVEGEVSFTRSVRPGIAVPRPIYPARAFCRRVVQTGYTDLEISAYLESVRDLPLVPTGLDARESVPLDTEERAVLAVLPEHPDLSDLERRLQTSGGLPAAATRRAVFIGLSAGWLASPGFARA